MSAEILDGLAVRAAVYEMLAIGFAYPDAAQRERVRGLATALEPWIGLIHPDWAERVQALEQSLDATATEELEAEFNVLFSGAMECAPYESAFERDIFRKQHALADIAGFYRAFGFELGAASRWQPDHIGVQLEFCSIVLQRTAEALEQGWDEQIAICVDAFRKYLAEHPGRWITAFAGDVAAASRIPYYQTLAALTASWLELELGALDLEPDRLLSRRRFVADEALPTCGGCTLCPPEQQTMYCTGPPGGPPEASAACTFET
jgi:TorA maturation chaperone TorD